MIICTLKEYLLAAMAALNDVDRCTWNEKRGFLGILLNPPWFH